MTDRDTSKRRKWIVPLLAGFLAVLFFGYVLYHGITPTIRKDVQESRDGLPEYSPNRAAPSDVRPNPGATELRITTRGLIPEVPKTPSLDEQLEKMDWGSIAFNTPKTIPYKKPQILELVINPSLDAEELTKLINRSGPVETDRVKISELMQARLVGANFTITVITPEIQPVGKKQTTGWKWEVIPQKPGFHSLYLTIHAMVRVRETERPYPVKTFDREIEVKVTGIQKASFFLRTNWMWVVALIVVIAAAGFLAKKIVGRPAGVPFDPRQEFPGSDEPVDIFVSYSSKDRETVVSLVDRLRKNGLKVWIDQGGIDGALLWGQEIVDAIHRCRVVMIFGSSQSFASPNVVKEICLASEQRKHILPIYLEPVDVPKSVSYHLAGIQHIEFFRGNREHNLTVILRSLERLGIKAGLSDPMIGQ